MQKHFQSNGNVQIFPQTVSVDEIHEPNTVVLHCDQNRCCCESCTMGKYIADLGIVAARARTEIRARDGGGSDEGA